MPSQGTKLTSSITFALFHLLTPTNVQRKARLCLQLRLVVAELFPHQVLHPQPQQPASP